MPFAFIRAHPRQRADSARRRLPALRALALIAALLPFALVVASPARAADGDLGSRSSPLEHFPEGASLYLELIDPADVLSRTLASEALVALRARPELAAFWSSQDAIPLRIWLGILEGWSGLSTAQVLESLQGARISVATYPRAATPATDSDRFLLVVGDASPALERLLARAERLVQGTARASNAGSGSILPITRPLTFARRGQAWLVTDDPTLTAEGATARRSIRSQAGVADLRDAARPERWGWIWLARSERARLDAVLRQLRPVFPFPDRILAVLQERLATTPWTGAELGMELTHDAAGGRRPLRLSIGVVAPAAGRSEGGPPLRIGASGIQLRELIRGALATTSSAERPAPDAGRRSTDPRADLALAIASLVDQVELTRRTRPWTVLELAASFVADPGRRASEPRDVTSDAGDVP